MRDLFEGKPTRTAGAKRRGAEAARPPVCADVSSRRKTAFAALVPALLFAVRMLSRRDDPAGAQRDRKRPGSPGVLIGVPRGKIADEASGVLIASQVFDHHVLATGDPIARTVN